jgi:TonB family protein
MEFLIKPNGCAVDIQVIESEPSDIFDEAAREALATWAFEIDESEEVQTGTQTIEFELAGGTCDPHNKSLNSDAGEAGAG